MASTSQLGSDGSGVPRSTHSDADKWLIINKKVIFDNILLRLEIMDVKSAFVYVINVLPVRRT